jgi:hypothetical protein
MASIFYIVVILYMAAILFMAEKNTRSTGRLMKLPWPGFLETNNLQTQIFLDIWGNPCGEIETEKEKTVK